MELALPPTHLHYIPTPLAEVIGVLHSDIVGISMSMHIRLHEYAVVHPRYAANGVLVETLQFLGHYISADTRVKNGPELLAASAESRAMQIRPQDESEMKPLLEQVPSTSGVSIYFPRPLFGSETCDRDM